MSETELGPTAWLIPMAEWLSTVDLEGIIEPLLPDSPARPAKWWAEDIAKAIREKAA